MIPTCIYWNIDPVWIDFGSFAIRYYTVLFGAGIFLGAWFVHRIFRTNHIPDETFLPLFYFVFFGIVLGARLGHCLFYEPDYFLHHPLEILLPFQIKEGEFIFTGYRGLASHGGAIGVVIALYLFCRKNNYSMLELLDYIAIAAPLTAAFIRLGNLMNSEIVGEITSVPWAFCFALVDGMPRHPAQLYEAIAYFLLFLLNMYIYKKYKNQLSPGFLLGVTLTYIFTYRFFIEFLKINQVDFEENITFNMGQLLSIPYILAGLYFMFIHPKIRNHSKRETKETKSQSN